ncbi:MAG: hypothetical protein MUF13_15365 [Akkermansiaceae bacterium]|nr:hypothetical protein [Akkermansiaceae bacterium]
MIQRFQIEDLIVQDTSGVVFRALDLETGNVVALRRFFPFGADGGGLQAEEQAAYNIAVSRLAALQHPSLRAVICGDCDPVDGMPFIATEWVEGDTLGVTLANGPLEASVAVRLITQALEVSELLSHVLAEEGVWVETDLQAIVVGSEASGRGFTFWISPLKWLSRDDRTRGLESIVSLTEEVMGWKGRLVNDQAGRGLGGWVKWLSTVSSTTTLLEARESLAASVGAEPPPSAKNLVVKATTRPLVRPAVPLKPHSSKAPILAACALSLIVAGVGAFVWMRKSAPEKPAALPENLPALSKQAPTKSAEKPKPKPAQAAAAATSEVSSDEVAATDDVTKKANELLARLQETDQEHQEKLKTQQAVADQQGGVILWNQKELLLAQEDKVVTISGKPETVKPSTSGKTIYLNFGSKANGDTFRAGMKVGNSSKEEVTKSLEAFLNQELEITGKVIKQQFGDSTHELIFNSPEDIKIKK